MLQLLNKNSHLPNCRHTTIPLRMGSIPSGGCVLEKLWNLNSWKYVNPFHQAAIVFTNLIILNAKFRLRVQVPQPWAWNCLHSQLFLMSLMGRFQKLSQSNACCLLHNCQLSARSATPLDSQFNLSLCLQPQEISVSVLQLSIPSFSARTLQVWTAFCKGTFFFLSGNNCLSRILRGCTYTHFVGRARRSQN